MVYVFSNAWALLLGILLLMLGNGMQTSLLAVRGDLENFSASTMSIIMSGYFVGFLFGSRLAPVLIHRVGHVRVFAAMASLISAAFILFAAIPDPIAWTVLRIVVGLGFSCVYVVAESWLNEVSTNETRGQALSAYLVIQMVGIVSAQVLLAYGDATGYVLFVLMSVLVSVSFLPILLSVNAAPHHDHSKRMTIRQLVEASPLGAFGALILGGLFAVQFAMAPVYATTVGLPVEDLASFVSSIFVGGMVSQYPIGWLSDRLDRRLLIIGGAAVGAAIMFVGSAYATASFPLLLAMGFMMGAITNPLYSLILAYVNDYLPAEDMASASSGLIFLNGLGAVAGPIPAGWLMSRVGPIGFFWFSGALFGAIAVFALVRATLNPVRDVEAETAYAPLGPEFTAVATDLAQEFAEDQSGEDVEDAV